MSGAWRWQPTRRLRDGSIELRWLSRRSVSGTWYPQGIDTGTWRGMEMVAVSWFRRDRTGAHTASRLTMIDLARSRRIDIALAVPTPEGLAPALIHAGGIAWTGDRLFVSATTQGIWEFDLARIHAVGGAAGARLRGGGDVWGFGRPTPAVLRTRILPVPLRCSFIGRSATAGGAPERLVVGEYRTSDAGRLVEFDMPRAGDDAALRPTARLEPGLARMQGAVRLGETWLVSQSDGLRSGRLWRGDTAPLSLHPRPLPVGTEDLALDEERGLLWSLGEHPWHRVVRGIPLEALGL